MNDEKKTPEVKAELTGPEHCQGREPMIALYFRLSNHQTVSPGILRGDPHFDVAVDSEFSLLCGANPCLREMVHDAVDRALTMALDAQKRDS